jgi:hypothetical protein
MTIPLWCYLESHPAISLTGLIRSSNQIAKAPVLAKTLCPETAQHVCDPITNLKPTPRTLRWGEDAETLIQFYKFNFVEEEAYFELSSAAKPTAFLPKRVYLETFMYVSAYTQFTSQTDFTSGPDAPYKCSSCQSEEQNILDGPESLARHHIACHSVPESNQSSSAPLRQLTNSPPLSKRQNEQMPQASCSTEIRAEESAPLRANSLLVTLKVSRAGHSKQPQEPKDTQITQVNDQEAGSMALPNSHGGSDLHLPGLSSEEFSETHRLGKAVESHTTSTSGNKETSKDTQREKELLAEQVAVQAGSNSVLPSPALASPIIEGSTALSAKHPHRQGDTSPTTPITQRRRGIDTSASVSSPYITDVSYTASLGATATSLPNASMDRYYSNGSTASTFSTVPDSVYASCESQDSGFCSQLVEAPEDSTDTTFTNPTTVALGWMPDTELGKLYTFLAPKGQQPYFQLRQEYKATPETPQRVYLDPHQ